MKNVKTASSERGFLAFDEDKVWQDAPPGNATSPGLNVRPFDAPSTGL